MTEDPVNSPAAVSVCLRSSRFAALLLLAMHAGTALVWLSLPLSSTISAAGLAVIAVVLIHEIMRVSLRRLPQSIVSLVVQQNRTLAITRRSGASEEGLVAQSTYVGAHITCLQWHSTGAYPAHAMLLLPDMMTADEFRRLRVMLRLGRPSPLDQHF